MDLVDSTAVNVAGPTLQEGLGASATDLRWVIGGYPLALGAGLVFGGRLGDRFGRRRTFLVGMLGFTLASLACALAPTIGVLITLRLVQGAFGAVLLPQGIGLLRSAFPPQELGRAFAVFGPAFGLAGIFGPLIGGGLIQADLFGLQWRSIFLVNVPIGLVVVVVAALALPRGGEDRSLRLDLTGALLVIAASCLVVLPLIQGQAAGWPVWTWVSLVVGVALFLLFAVQQRARSARGRDPLIVPTILRKPQFVIGLGGLALFFAGLVGLQLVLTLFVQIGQGFSAGQAGLATLPVALGSAVGGAVSGAVLAEKLGRGVLQLGAVVELVGVALLWVMTDAGRFSYWQLVPGLALVGVGIGLSIAALFTVLVAAVDDAEAGSASGVLSAVQSVASSIGVAVTGTIFFSYLEGSNLSSSGFLIATDDGLHWALVVNAALVMAFLLLSFFFPQRALGEEPAVVQVAATDRAATDQS